MARSKRRRGQGRKRKALPRCSSGRLSRSTARVAVETDQRDCETRSTLTELHAGRARALGLTEDQSSHPCSSTIAGRMALRGMITFVEAEAIDEYAKLVRRAAILMRAPAGPRCSLSLSHGGDGLDDPEAYALAMRRYNEAFSVVREVGVRACRAINIIVRDLCELPPSERPFVAQAAQSLASHFGFVSTEAA